MCYFYICFFSIGALWSSRETLSAMASASKVDRYADTSLFQCVAQENSQPSAGGSRFDSHGHQFARTDRAMQTLLSENVFDNTLMDDSSFTALLSLPSSEAANLLEQPSFCSETFAGDSLVGGWEQSCHFGPDSVNLSRETLATATTACLAIIPSDPGFVERAAKFSTFANGIGTEESAPASSGISSGGGNEAITGPGIVRPEESGKKLPKSAKENRFKKRKIPQSSGKPANSEQVEAKRWKSSNANHKNVKDDAIEDSEFQVEQKSGTNTNSAESIPKETENKKNSKAPAVVEKSNYIHVRARRGQATDSHSLAERVRREKISERMKLLQDLVPGCSKITGKAVMLDEIINHVQCLQRKVEFLSMKLAMVNPSRDFDLGQFFAEEMMNMAPCSGNSSDSREWTAPLSACLRYNNLEQASLQTVVTTSGPDLTSAWNGGLQNILVRDRYSPFES